MRILVIADDITGAAEMAGIAHRMGCKVRFSTVPTPFVGEEEVMVWATDTRSVAREEAVAITLQAAAVAAQCGEVILFKKTDSVLRGHVVAELQALMGNRFERTLLLPANPSKGRCIVEGVYTIGGTPIAETIFSTDPEFPARCSDVVGLVGGGVSHICDPQAELPLGISIGESRTEEEVAAWIAQYNPSLLLAGAADAFKALLQREGFTDNEPAPFAGLGERTTLIALGSTVRHNLSEEPFFHRNCVAEAPMPDAVFNGGGCEEWIAEVLSANTPSLLLKIPQQVTIDGSRALHLRHSMATCVAEAVRQRRPEELVIEGGASAYAILATLGWADFTVCNEVAPGVVRLHHSESNTYLTFKPGSYDWGRLFC
ncbi:MAG: hypothetical protein IKZ12_01710 [Alistipes sp.]|nr:hypothetical protein [Alistipes sp.]